MGLLFAILIEFVWIILHSLQFWQIHWKLSIFGNFFYWHGWGTIGVGFLVFRYGTCKSRENTHKRNIGFVLLLLSFALLLIRGILNVPGVIQSNYSHTVLEQIVMCIGGGVVAAGIFLATFDEYDVQRVMRSYENSISIHVHCCEEGEWKQVCFDLYKSV